MEKIHWTTEKEELNNMTNEQRIKNLSIPQGKVDVVIDTDAYNECDDQFAIGYLLKSKERINLKAIYAAPFYNHLVKSPKEGMEKSYDEIFHILSLLGEEADVVRGSERFLENEETAVISQAAQDLAERVKNYSPENPLYVIAIGAITNVASATLLNPQVAENTVVIWLGGHALHYHDILEFNMNEDIAAARVVFRSGVPLVQLPCCGVVNAFAVSEAELDFWFSGKNTFCDYLVSHAKKTAKDYSKGRAWSRVIWDVTAVAWLLNDDDRFMLSRVIPRYMPTYEGKYKENPDGMPMRYVYYLRRDNLFNDLIDKITG